MSTIEQIKLAQLHRPYVGNDPNAAPLIVLLHGFGASNFTWRNVAKPLSEIGEVWGYERPGFGFTERPTQWTGTNPYSVSGQLEILEHQVSKMKQGRKVIVIGHSAGGQIATYFAATHPLLVDALVLIAPAMIAAGAPEPLMKLFRNRLFDKLGPKLVGSFANAGIRLLEASVHDTKFISPEVLDGYLAPMQSANWHLGFWEFMRTAQPRDQKAAMAKTRCRALLITGDDDRVIPTKQTIKNAPRFAEHKLEIIANAGHICHEEQSEAFMALVNKHLPWLLNR